MAEIYMKSSSKEIHTDDLKVGQQDPILLKDDEEIDHEQIIVPIGASLLKEQVPGLAFGEEPITIRIERKSEKFAPQVVDIWVNGKGAEAFVNGKWVEFGFLPVGLPVITKRKYVEVMARSKVDNVSTETGSMFDENPANRVNRATSSSTPFSVLKDGNPLGAEWLTRLLQEG